MSARSEFRCIVLLEVEIRKAAKLLKRANELIDANDDEGPLGKEASVAILDAMQACGVALNGADSDDAILMLSAHDVAKVTIKVAEIKVAE